MKTLLKRLARPFMRRAHRTAVGWTLELTENRFAVLEQQLAALERDVAGLKRYVPAVLSAISTQNAMNRANVRTERELAELVSSVLGEFQRARGELLASRGIETGGPVLLGKVLRPDRLEAATAGAGLRLDIDSGESLPDHLRVSQTPSEHADVVADPHGLPFDPATVLEIRSAHLLERYSSRELDEVLLPHWRSLLAPGGTIVDVFVDYDALTRRYVGGELSLEVLRSAIFGEEGANSRRNLFTPAAISALLLGAGFAEVEFRDRDPETPSGELEVLARKAPGAQAS
jgi:hypothetical protein